MEWKRGLRYPIGSRVQWRNGYVFIKTDTGFKAEHRYVAEQKILGRELRPGEVVVRRTPDRSLNLPTNLVVVEHRLEKFKYLPHPRIIYLPAKAVARAQVA